MAMLFNEETIYRNPEATLSKNSKGRLKSIEKDGYRTEFQRDIHRILYSQPFRRLRHKTQVFFLPHHDHICTRMEHVLHVASISRTVARHLQLNEDLVEAIGLGHDLGHAPFGHHGEKILNKIAERIGLNTTFQHEIHGLRVVDKLAELDRETEAGLNLTYEVRDGIVSHCGEEFRREIFRTVKKKELELIRTKKEALTPCTLEGCIVRMVDKIAYAGRDIEDALVAKVLKEHEIPKEVMSVLGKNNGEFIGKLLEDLIPYSKRCGDRIGLSKKKHVELNRLIKFNYEKIYTNERVEKYKEQATRAIEELFSRLLKDLQITKRLTLDRNKLPNVPVYEVFHDFIKKIKYGEDELDAIIVCLQTFLDTFTKFKFAV